MPSRTPPSFPEPIYNFNGRDFWTRRQKRVWLSQCAGLPEPPPRDDDEYLLSHAQLREELGGVSKMWTWRMRRKAKRKPPVSTDETQVGDVTRGTAR